MLEEFMQRKDKWRYRKKVGYAWITYYYQNTYIKELHLKDTNYITLIEEIKNQNFLNEYFCQIMDIYYFQSQFRAYQMPKVSGTPLISSLNNSPDILTEFALIARQLEEILDFSKKNQIVLKDAITKGNILYDPLTKQVRVIDLDGLQTPFFTDHLISNTLKNSDWETTIFLKSRKYNTGCLYTTELNTFQFYELFFATVFHFRSLFSNKAFSLEDILFLKKRNTLDERIQKRKEIEKKLIDLLNSIRLNTHDDLYGKIIDLANQKTNEFNAQDFEYLANHYKLNRTRTRLIS